MHWIPCRFTRGASHAEIHPHRDTRVWEDRCAAQLELDGYAVVEEAATDVIALEQAAGVEQPWTHPSFIDTIVILQRQRQALARAAES